jgi:16S rRNA (uracil1498-N3)-methyltransferase
VTPADVDAVAHVFVPELDDRCEIVGDDGHHLRRVRRVGLGERVTAADDRGAWRAYEVVDVGPGRLVLAASSAAQVAAEATVSVSLAVAVPKTGLEGIVAAATELGAARVTPLLTERTVVRWDRDKATRVATRLRAVAREAAMQSRRARIPVIDDACDLDVITTARANVVVADRTGRPAFELTPPAQGEWTVVVGPEGGLSSDERERSAHLTKVALGSNVLRATTAPVAAVAILADRIAQNRRG